MSTRKRVCLQVSGVKLKHEEPVDVLTPALHPTVSSCMPVHTFVLTLRIVISSASPLTHMVSELKLRARNSFTAGWNVNLQPPPSLTRPLPSVTPCPPGAPLVWSLPPLHITFLPSLVRALFNLAKQTDTKGRQWQDVHPDKTALKQRDT